MANSSYTQNAPQGGVRQFAIQPRKMHLLSEPDNYIAGMAQSCVGYQATYSIKLLEEQLADAGTYFVLQLRTQGPADDWQPLTKWELFANGVMVASGTGEFAQECFYTSATEFMERCRDAVLESAVPKITLREYELLRMARSIVAISS